MSSPTETVPLVVGATTSNNKNGAFGVPYQPIDDVSATMDRRRRWKTKLGIVAIGIAVTAVIVGGVMMYHSSHQAATNLQMASVQADQLFAGLLFDEKAFYFPMDVSASSSSMTAEGGNKVRRRHLRALATSEEASSSSSSAAPWQAMDWSYNWNANGAATNKDFAAIGEYYRAKGMSLSDFYRSKYDPTYTAGGGSKASTSSTTTTTASEPAAAAPWTPDWQKDKERGIAIGQKYAAIGQHIADHYRAAFDPTYTPVDDSEDEDDVENRRYLKSKEKKKKEHEKKKKDKRDMMRVRDWRADRDRGMAIGQEFKELGQEIAAHYMDDDLSSTQWHDYRDHALAIAQRYQQKANAIQQFYNGNIDMEGMALPDDDENKASAGATPEATGSNDGSYMWGLDYKKDKKHAMAIRKAWMDRGMTIRDYYRSVYDPTFGAKTQDAGSVDMEGSTIGDAGSTTATSQHHPDSDYPPWGQDPEADRAHGKALGEYWAQKGQEIGQYWEKRGPELHAYYEDKYRSMFDPTYKGATANEP